MQRKREDRRSGAALFSLGVIAGGLACLVARADEPPPDSDDYLRGRIDGQVEAVEILLDSPVPPLGCVTVGQIVVAVQRWRAEVLAGDLTTPELALRVRFLRSLYGRCAPPPESAE